MNEKPTRVLPTLPAFLLGLGLGVGGTWLALPRQTPADAAGGPFARVERDARTSAPRQANLLVTSISVVKITVFGYFRG